MKRIMIVGGPGSGKSTLAVWLGEVTGLPVFHMDHLHYRAGWIAVPVAEKRVKANEIEALEQWIFEGNLSSTYANRESRADLVIWLDLPMMLRLWRTLRRVVKWRGRTRPDMAAGCPERFSGGFIWWILSSNRVQRGKIRDVIADRPSETIRHLQSRKSITEWQERVTAQGLPG